MLLAGFHFDVNAQTALDTCRSLFHSVSSESDLQRIINSNPSSTIENELIVIDAYKGICTSMLADYAVMPFSKMNYFKNGLHIINESIAKHKCLENVYIRLLLQLSAPGLLTDDEVIQSDIDYFLNQWAKSQLPTKEKRRFFETLLKTENEAYINKLQKNISID